MPLPPGPLVDPAALALALGEVTVLDVRWRLGRSDGLEQHLAGHVPGAVYVDLEHALAGPPGAGGRHPLPDTATFLAAMRAAGVTRHRTVVVHDDWGSMAATRAWWLLRDHGHPDVRVLDGGWAAWCRDGRPVETGPTPDPEPGDLDGAPGHLPVVDAEGAARVARDGVLVDARAPERFRGEVEPVDPVAGHVPGAVNVPSTANLADDGRFRSPDELAAAYDAVGADGSRQVAAYCGSGITATHDVFALALAGVEAALYPGSWSEWVRDPSRPVATDDAAR